MTWALPALLGLGVAGLDVGAAATQDLTSNINNSVSTATVPPPENVRATSTINLVTVSCKVRVTWTAPAATGIGGYEVRRVVASTNAELNPPTFTTNLFYEDTRTPLTVIGNAFAYQVRSVLAGTTWRSEWVTADAGVAVLCLTLTSPSAAPAAPAESDAGPGEPSDETPDQPTDVGTPPATSIGPATSVPDEQPNGDTSPTPVPSPSVPPTSVPPTSVPPASVPPGIGN